MLAFISFIVITTILIIIARLLRDIEKSLYKIEKHLERNSQENGNRR